MRLSQELSRLKSEKTLFPEKVTVWGYRWTSISGRCSSTTTKVLGVLLLFVLGLPGKFSVGVCRVSHCLHFWLFIESNPERAPEKQVWPSAWLFCICTCVHSLGLWHRFTELTWVLYAPLEKGRHWDQIGDTSPCSPIGASAWIFCQCWKCWPFVLL